MRLPLLARQATAEFLGSAGLVTVVIGSGFAAQRLSPGDTGVQLLENALVTAPGSSRWSSPSGRCPEATSTRSSRSPTGSSVGSAAATGQLSPQPGHALRGLARRRPGRHDLDAVRCIVDDLDARVRTLLAGLTGES